jgi:hypothetical protein
VWGINDFDEAYDLPYTVDLVRLAASASIAVREARLRIVPRDACFAILDGYRKGLESGGHPIVLAEEHQWLRSLVTGVLRDPVQFWAKMDSLPPCKGAAPKSARKAIETLLPEKQLKYRIVHRVAGLGSLGRERYVAIAEYRGAQLAREAKALAPSACAWAAKGKVSERIRYQEIMDRSLRAADPFVRLRGRWIVRRLAPDCSRVELAAMPRERDEIKLLRMMGFETANVHLGTARAARPILKDLAKRPRNWLHRASGNMVKVTTKDWQDWHGKM